MSHYAREAPKLIASLPEALANINSRVLDDGSMKKIVDPDIYYAFDKCRSTGKPMAKKDANLMSTFQEKFYSGAQKHDVPEKVYKEMFQNIETTFSPWKFPPTDRFNWAKEN